MKTCSSGYKVWNYSEMQENIAYYDKCNNIHTC
jgi:hypothetical protein